jgi:four helix bundle protein
MLYCNILCRQQIMQHYSELEVWKRSHQLVLALNRYTQEFPAGERYGLTSQIRRAALSVPTNIAEGSSRLRKKAVHELVFAFWSSESWFSS